MTKSSIARWERRTMSAGELKKMVTENGQACAWRGCNANFKTPMPSGWVNLVTWWAKEPDPWRTVIDICSDPHCQRDATLCPKHAAELEAMLTDIGNQLKEVKGSA
jgi:hypothetical protein